MSNEAKTQMGYIKIDKLYPMQEGLNKIGRHKKATVILKNLSVSEHHAVVTIVDGSHFISDFGSKNGTYLNDEPLTPLRCYKLCHNSQIKFGDVSSTYQMISNEDYHCININEALPISQSSCYDQPTQLLDRRSPLPHMENSNDKITSNNMPPPLEKIVVMRTALMEENIHQAQTQIILTSELNNAEESIHNLSTQFFAYDNTSNDTKLNHTSINSLFGEDETEQMSIHDAKTQLFCTNDVTIEKTTVIDDSFLSCTKDLNAQISEDSNGSLDLLTEDVLKPSKEASDSDSQSKLHLSQLQTLNRRVLMNSEDDEENSDDENIILKKLKKPIKNKIYSDSDTDIEEAVITPRKVGSQSKAEVNEADTGLKCNKDERDSSSETDVDETLMDYFTKDKATEDSSVADSNSNQIKTKETLEVKIDKLEVCGKNVEAKKVPESSTNFRMLQDEFPDSGSSFKFGLSQFMTDSEGTECKGRSAGSEENQEITNLSKNVGRNTADKIYNNSKENNVNVTKEDITAVSCKLSTTISEMNTKDAQMDIGCDDISAATQMIDSHNSDDDTTSNISDQDMQKTVDVVCDDIDSVASRIIDGNIFCIATQKMDSQDDNTKCNISDQVTEKIVDNPLPCKKVGEECVKDDDGIFMMATQKIGDNKLDSQDDDEDDRGTQKIVDGPLENEKIDIRDKDDIFMMATQKNNDVADDAIFSVPIQAIPNKNKITLKNQNINFTPAHFKVKETTEEAEDDIFFMPTQKIGQETIRTNEPNDEVTESDENVIDDEFFIAVTQKSEDRLSPIISNEPVHKGNYLDVISDSEKYLADELFMAATQISEDNLSSITSTEPVQKENDLDKISDSDKYFADGELFMAATQKSEDNLSSTISNEPVQEENDADKISESNKYLADDELFMSATQKSEDHLSPIMSNEPVKKENDLAKISESNKYDDEFFMAATQKFEDPIKKENNLGRITEPGENSTEDNVKCEVISSKIEKKNTEKCIPETKTSSDAIFAKPIPITIRHKFDEVESQLEVMFASQPVFIENKERPPNPLAITFQEASENEIFSSVNEVVVQTTENDTLHTLKRKKPGKKANPETNPLPMETRAKRNKISVTNENDESKVKKPMKSIYLETRSTNNEVCAVNESVESIMKKPKSVPLLLPIEVRNKNNKISVINQNDESKITKPVEGFNSETLPLPREIRGKTKLSLRSEGESKITKPVESSNSETLPLPRETRDKSKLSLRSESESKITKPVEGSNSETLPLPRETRGKNKLSLRSETESKITKPAESSNSETLPLPKETRGKTKLFLRSEGESKISKPVESSKSETLPLPRETRDKSKLSLRSESESKITKPVESSNSETLPLPRETRGKSKVSTTNESDESNSSKSSFENVTQVTTRKRKLSLTTNESVKKRITNDETLLSPNRARRQLKPKVVFTMLDSPELESVVRQLGGQVVDNVDSCTVLVTAALRRSMKLLATVGQAKPICSPLWLQESKKHNKFLDPWEFILEDTEAETKWNFSLTESLQRSSQEKLLDGYTIQIAVTAAVDVLKEAIKCSGGKCVSRAPPKAARKNFIIVTTHQNKNKYLKLSQDIPKPIIVEAEAIFDGVLRQELNWDNHRLL